MPVTLKIEKIVYPGRRLALDQGKVVFTDRGLPGETVEVELLKDRASFAEGRTTTVVEPSADRVEPRCGHFLACSPYQDMRYETQLEVKRGQVQEILARELRIEASVPAVTPSPEVWGYRNRIRLKVLWREDGPSFVYHEPGEETVYVPVDRCFLVSDAVNDLLAELRDFLRREEWEAVAAVEVRESRARKRSLVIFHLASASRIDEMTAKLSGLHERFPLSGIAALVQEGKKVHEVRMGGVARLEETVRGLTYRIGARSFFQVNVGILEAVFDDIDAAVRGLEGAGVADLYCGLGTFGIALAKGAREVFGVEPEPANIAFLKKNMALNGVGNFAVCEGTAEEWVEYGLDKEVEVVLVDPPRRGVDPAVLAELTVRPVARLVYLSCNPTTLARDLKTLLGAYRLKDIKIYDFFPHTPHIETLAVLERA